MVYARNYFEINGQVKQKLSGTAISTKLAPVNASIFIGDIENKFLQTQLLQPLIWFRYIGDVFFVWTHREEKFQSFLIDLNNYNPNNKFPNEFNKERKPFLGLRAIFCDSKLTADLYLGTTDRHQCFHYISGHSNNTERFIIYSHALRLSAYVHIKMVLKIILRT